MPASLIQTSFGLAIIVWAPHSTGTICNLEGSTPAAGADDVDLDGALAERLRRQVVGGRCHEAPRMERRHGQRRQWAMMHQRRRYL